jgi:hypothetical protein
MNENPGPAGFSTLTMLLAGTVFCVKPAALRMVADEARVDEAAKGVEITFLQINEECFKLPTSQQSHLDTSSANPRTHVAKSANLARIAIFDSTLSRGFSIT